MGRGSTYPTRLASVAGHTEQLFIGQKSSKARCLFVVCGRGNLHGTTAHPVNAVGPGEQSLHESILTADHDINIATAHAGTLVRVVLLLDAVHSSLGIDRVSKLHIAGHGLASGSLHDDVDRPARSEVGITPEELNHLLPGDRVGNLYQRRAVRGRKRQMRGEM